MNSYSDAAKVLGGHIKTEPVGEPVTSPVRAVGDTRIKVRRNLVSPHYLHGEEPAFPRPGTSSMDK